MSELYRRALAEMEAARSMLALETEELARDIARLQETVSAKRAALAQLESAITAFAPVVSLGGVVPDDRRHVGTAPLSASPLTPAQTEIPTILEAAVAVLREAAGEPVSMDMLAAAVAVRRRGLTTKKDSVSTILNQTLAVGRVSGLEKTEDRRSWLLRAPEPAEEAQAAPPALETATVLPEAVSHDLSHLPVEPQDDMAVTLLTPDGRIVTPAACPPHDYRLERGETQAHCKTCGVLKDYPVPEEGLPRRAFGSLNGGSFPVLGQGAWTP